MSAIGNFQNGAFFTQFRVYYEDTDAAGIVYYANYLKYAERARTDALRACGINQSELLQQYGLGFVVRKVGVDYLSPASLDDEISVETRLQKLGRVRMSMLQMISRGDTVLTRLEVDIAMIDAARKPAKIPPEIIQALCEHLHVEEKAF
jgi:acyl-CoA thioester hydrolase